MQAPCQSILTVSSDTNDSLNKGWDAPGENEVNAGEPSTSETVLSPDNNDVHNCPVGNKKGKNSTKHGNAADMKNDHEEKCGRHSERHAFSSSLPLVFPDKVHLTKALVEAEDETLDLSGDMGSVGRIIISESSDVLLDLKGKIYNTSIVPSRTFCLVSFGQTEAKIEAVMNDFIQLKPMAAEFEAETLVQGTLQGFLFDSDDEADNKLPKTVPDKAGAEQEPENKPTPVKTQRKRKSGGGGKSQKVKKKGKK